MVKNHHLCKIQYRCVYIDIANVRNYSFLNHVKLIYLITQPMYKPIHLFQINQHALKYTCCIKKCLPSQPT